MAHLNVVVDGVLASRLIVAAVQFDYEAFNAHQAELEDDSEKAHRRIQEKADEWKISQARKARKLEKEYTALMDEWLYRKSPQYATLEALCTRMSDIELEMSKIL